MNALTLELELHILDAHANGVEHPAGVVNLAAQAVHRVLSFNPGKNGSGRSESELEDLLWHAECTPGAMRKQLKKMAAMEADRVTAEDVWNDDVGRSIDFLLATPDFS